MEAHKKELPSPDHMPLTCCPKCRSEYSASLEKCPHCKEDPRPAITATNLTAFVIFSTSVYLVFNYTLKVYASRTIVDNTEILQFVDINTLHIDHYGFSLFFSIFSSFLCILYYTISNALQAFKDSDIKSNLSLLSPVSLFFLVPLLVALTFYPKLINFSISIIWIFCFTLVSILLISHATRNSLTRYAVINSILIMAFSISTMSSSLADKDHTSIDSDEFSTVTFSDSNETHKLQLKAVYGNDLLFGTEDNRTIVTSKNRIKSLENEKYSIYP